MGRDHQELGKAKLLEQTKPVFTLDHLVRERYPTFVHALRDIDDALCMVHLYAMLPVGTSRVRHPGWGWGWVNVCLCWGRCRFPDEKTYSATPMLGRE